ncbi:hypothetical protein Droror1_Dr00008186 [Drosera rotundifolia]
MKDSGNRTQRAAPRTAGQHHEIREQHPNPNQREQHHRTTPNPQNNTRFGATETKSKLLGGKIRGRFKTEARTQTEGKGDVVGDGRERWRKGRESWKERIGGRRRWAGAWSAARGRGEGEEEKEKSGAGEGIGETRELDYSTNSPKPPNASNDPETTSPDDFELGQLVPKIEQLHPLRQCAFGYLTPQAPTLETLCAQHPIRSNAQDNPQFQLSPNLSISRSPR